VKIAESGIRSQTTPRSHARSRDPLVT
jgi:hypothetical protein